MKARPYLLVRIGGLISNWMAETGLGYWAVRVETDGYYDFTIQNQAIRKGSRVLVRVGQTQRSLQTDQDGSKQEVISQVYLKRGDYNLESWLETDRGTLGPFFVDVKKH